MSSQVPAILQKRISLKREIARLREDISDKKVNESQALSCFKYLENLYSDYKSLDSERFTINGASYDERIETLHGDLNNVWRKIEQMSSSSGSTSRDDSKSRAISPPARSQSSSEPEKKLTKIEDQESSKEKKYTSVTKVIDAILDVDPARESSRGLMRLSDEVKQRVGELQHLGMKRNDRMVIRIFERALPSSIRKKWQARALTLKNLPSLNSLFDFVDKTALSLIKQENADSGGKRKPEYPVAHAPSSSKSRRLDSDRSLSCYYCRGGHKIYECQEYRKLAYKRKWEVVLSKNLCENCLNPHAGCCNSRGCFICDRFHNILLHPEQAE